MFRPAPEGPVVDSPRERPAAHNPQMRSRVHPKYKTRYHVHNWAAYERTLVDRGDITVWLSQEAIAAWEPEGGGTRGGQRKYSDVAIEDDRAWSTRVVRDRSVMNPHGWGAFGASFDSGMIVAQALTDATADDAQTGITLMEAVDGSVASVTADAAYDTIALYDTATKRGAKVVVPPAKTASLSRRGPRSTARDRTIRKITKVGRRRWKKEAGYHRQARVENMIFRYKSILGGGLRARTPGGQDVESVLACNVLNRMTELGRPESFAIGR